MAKGGYPGAMAMIGMSVPVLAVLLLSVHPEDDCRGAVPEPQNRKHL